MSNIIVFGANSGIGKSCINQLNRSNHSLGLVSRNIEKLNMQASALSHSPQIFNVDYSCSDSIKLFDQQIVKNEIDWDGIVFIFPRVEKTSDFQFSEDKWNQILNLTFVRPLKALESAISKLKNNGRIVIISGISNIYVMPHYALSNVIRMMWLGHAKTLAHNLGEKGIRVNTISLGGVETEHFISGLQQRASERGITLMEQRASETSNIPLKKYGDPDSLAKLIEGFLFEMSDHVTGSNIRYEGGFIRSY